MAYCDIQNDLKDVFSDIGRYAALNILTGWKKASGQVNTYYVRGVGHIEAVYDDGIVLTSRDSVADTESNAGSYYHDSTNDLLYVHAKDGDDLTSQEAPTIEEGIDWATMATRAINEASEEIDSYLNPQYDTPLLPRLRNTHAAEEYETTIRRACALLAARTIIFRNDPTDPKGFELEKKALNFEPEPGEEYGIIAELKRGDRVLQDQITAREVGGFNVYPTSGNTGTRIRLIGTYTGDEYRTWKLEIDGAGAQGTATWKLSYDGGTTWDKENEDTFDATNDDRRVELADGISCVFLDTFAEGDSWIIELHPLKDQPQGGKVSSSMMLR